TGKTTPTTPTATGSPQRKIAPGPRGKIIFGSVLEMMRDPISFISELARDYGDIAHMRLLSEPAFVISHPDYARHVLLDNHQNDGRNSVAHKMIRSVIGRGLATNEGESWLHQRRLMQPTFHHKRITAFGTQMTEATITMLQRWQHVAGQDQPLDILKQMQ